MSQKVFLLQYTIKFLNPSFTCLQFVWKDKVQRILYHSSIENMLSQKAMLLFRMNDLQPKFLHYSLLTRMQLSAEADMWQVACYNKMYLVKHCLKTNFEVRREVLDSQPGSPVVLCYVKTHALNACFSACLMYCLLLSCEISCFPTSCRSPDFQKW